jgi:hypothetical protein
MHVNSRQGGISNDSVRGEREEMRKPSDARPSKVCGKPGLGVPAFSILPPARNGKYGYE